MKKILVTGGTGFVGEKLCYELFRKGYALTLLTRNPKRAAEKIPLPYQFIQWDSKTSLPEGIMEDIHAVVHLAGESVAAHRWSKTVKQEIHDSRSISTKLLAEAINRAKNKPEVFIGASATGIYGDRGAEALTEESTPGNDFLAGVCRDWEAAYASAAKRTVLLRTGVVWGANGGALEKMLPLFRFGLGGKIGNGKQWVSWIHLADLVSLYIFALENEKVSGVLNAVAPEPATNIELTQTIGLALNRAAIIPVPGIALKLGLGEMSTVLLSSQRVFPKAAEKSGFKFRFPTLQAAIREILAPLGKKGAYTFEAALWLNEKQEKVFAFFSAAENLEKITPPWLKFRIEKSSTNKIQEGTLIDYKLRIKGMPVHWRTRIEKWEPEASFVDRQLKGPYKDWHHTHHFEKIGNGTLMSDRVVYEIGFGVLGDLARMLVVKRDVATIFAFRKKVIGTITF
jgi:uncharacterized protein (TIGR01777 family)